MFVCDREKAHERDQWRCLFSTLRRLYRTEDERELFKLWWKARAPKRRESTSSSRRSRCARTDRRDRAVLTACESATRCTARCDRRSADARRQSSPPRTPDARTNVSCGLSRSGIGRAAVRLRPASRSHPYTKSLRDQMGTRSAWGCIQSVIRVRGYGAPRCPAVRGCCPTVAGDDETLLPGAGEHRAWDKLLRLVGATPRYLVGVDIESRVWDVQAIVRRTRGQGAGRPSRPHLAVLRGHGPQPRITDELRASLGRLPDRLQIDVGRRCAEASGYPLAASSLCDSASRSPTVLRAVGTSGGGGNGGRRQRGEAGRSSSGPQRRAAPATGSAGPPRPSTATPETTR